MLNSAISCFLAMHCVPEPLGKYDTGEVCLVLTRVPEFRSCLRR